MRARVRVCTNVSGEKNVESWKKNPDFLGEAVVVLGGGEGEGVGATPYLMAGETLVYRGVFLLCVGCSAGFLTS